MKIIFVCATCEYRSDINRGMPDHVEVDSRYENLTDALSHYEDNNKYDYHVIEARIENDES